MSTDRDFNFDADDGEIRPFGWGVCQDCGHDAEEADYDPETRRTICARCRGDHEPPDVEFERALAIKVGHS